MKDSSFKPETKLKNDHTQHIYIIQRAPADMINASYAKSDQSDVNNYII